MWDGGVLVGWFRLCLVVISQHACAVLDKVVDTNVISKALEAVLGENEGPHKDILLITSMFDTCQIKNFDVYSVGDKGKALV